MKLILSLFVTCGLIAVCCKSTRGEEPAQAFLDGLRARGYHDTALEYLKSLESSRMVPAGMRDVLGYETALTLVIASRSSGELEERYAMLDRAQNLLPVLMWQIDVPGALVLPASVPWRMQLSRIRQTLLRDF